MRWVSPYRIELTDDERSVLRRHGRSLTAPYRVVIRARALLLAAEKIDNSEIAERLNVSRSFVSELRKRFCRERLEALEDRPRSGSSRSFFPSANWQRSKP
jgi:transcriptional antiterminator